MCASPLLCRLTQTTPDDRAALVAALIAIWVVGWILDVISLRHSRRDTRLRNLERDLKTLSPNSSWPASSTPRKASDSSDSTIVLYGLQAQRSVSDLEWRPQKDAMPPPSPSNVIFPSPDPWAGMRKEE